MKTQQIHREQFDPHRDSDQQRTNTGCLCCPKRMFLRCKRHPSPVLVRRKRFSGSSHRRLFRQRAGRLGARAMVQQLH